MRKMKALFLTLALGFTFAAAATAVACDKGEGAPTTSSDWFAGQEESLVSLRFDTSFLSMYQYESLALDCKVSGTTSKVEFSSSDETLATVDENGVVTTKDAMGKVVITATVEGVSATCEITVEKAPYAPELILNATEYTVENGDTLEFDVATEWNQTAMTEDVEYTATLAETSKDAKAVVSVEGNTVKVVTGGVETIDVIVSATVRGIYTSKSVTIDVKESVLKIQALSTDFKPVAGKYETTISTTDLIGDMANSVAMNFAATKGGQVVDGATIDWEISGDAVAIENDMLVGKKRGSAVLTGTVTLGAETATVEVACEVVPPEVHLEQTEVLEVEDLKSITIKEKLIGTLLNAEFQGTKVSSMVIPAVQRITLTNYATTEDKENRTNALFPTESALLGKQQLVINTDLVVYTMDVEVYTMVINDADELDMMRTLAHTGQTEFNERYQTVVSSEYYDGYFVLGNDIDYNKTIKSMTDTGSVWWCQGYTWDLTRGFKGVFDGRGYNIDGVTVGTPPSGDAKQSGGIFGYISKTGVVRNVSFTNATLLANNGFICSAGDGTIENVSISYKKIGGDKETAGINSAEPRIMGSFFTQKAGSNATVKNCLIDASAADITVEKGMYNGQRTMPIKLLGSVANVENVITICPNQELLAASGADVTRLTYNEVIAEGGLINEFDKSIWTTVEGIPMFVNQANTLNRDAAIEFINVESSLVVGFEMLVLTNNPYVKIEVEDVEGVTFESSLLTAQQVAFDKTVTLTATSLLNPEITATHKVYIDSFGLSVKAPEFQAPAVVYNTNPVLTIGDNSWKGEKNYVYLGAYSIGECVGDEDLTVDVSKLVWGTQKVTIVSEKNGARENFIVDLKLDYVKADQATGEKIFDSALSGRTSQGTEYSFTEVESDVEAPEGYTNVTRLDCNVAWGTALASSFWHSTAMSEYSDFWFCMKIVNGRWVMQTVTVETSGWVYFHYTQTSENVWVVEVKLGDSVYKTEFDVKGTKLQDLLYRSGWGDGFLLYNNNQGEQKEVCEDGITRPILPFTTSIYATEVYGVKKA